MKEKCFRSKYHSKTFENECLRKKYFEEGRCVLKRNHDKYQWGKYSKMTVRRIGKILRMFEGEMFGEVFKNESSGVECCCDAGNTC